MRRGRSQEENYKVMVVDDDIGINPEPIYNRKLTWCDVFYMAAVEATKNSHILITRYPVNTIGGFSQ